MTLPMKSENPATGKIPMQAFVIQSNTQATQQINKAEEDDEEFYIGSIQAENQDHPVSQRSTLWMNKRKMERRSDCQPQSFECWAGYGS